VTSGESGTNLKAFRNFEAANPYAYGMGITTPAGLSEEKAARMMTALREGQTLRRFFVSRPRLQAYFNIHPDYAREALPLVEANAKAARLRKGDSERNRTHCNYGHPLSGINLLSRPGRNGRTWRKCVICLQRRDQNPRPPSKEQIDRATAALNAGSTLTLVCTGKVGPERVQARILTYRKLKLYRQLNPAFDRFVIAATADSNSNAQQRRYHPERHRFNIIRGETNDYRKILAMMPSGLPPDVRDDVAQSMFLALLEGSLQRDQVGARVKQFLSAHNRESNKHGTGKYGLRSIDAPAYSEGSATFGDTISRGLWD
jgi:hypothetical protein